MSTVNGADKGEETSEWFPPIQREETSVELALTLGLGNSGDLLSAIKQKHQLISTSEDIRAQWRLDVAQSSATNLITARAATIDDLELEDLVEVEPSEERIGSIMLDNFFDQEEDDDEGYVPSLIASSPMSVLNALSDDKGQKEEGTENEEEEVIDEEEEGSNSDVFAHGNSDVDPQELAVLMSSLARLRTTCGDETRSEADEQVQPFEML